MFVTVAVMFLSAPVAGQFARRMDPRIMLAAGLAMFGGGIWWMAHLTVNSAFWDLFGPQALRGFAISRRSGTAALRRGTSRSSLPPNRDRVLSVQTSG
ncbi:MAG TPA: hypothetical protein VND19_22380 [Acetobacteraceae bacterium]|nr:hypothetical protein [Acetobacteraceae bacterium]